MIRMDLGVMIGETLGRYPIGETIGAGGMKVVDRADDPTLDREGEDFTPRETIQSVTRNKCGNTLAIFASTYSP